MKQYGWDAFFEENFRKYKEQGFSPARICMEHKNIYHLYTNNDILLGEVSGKFRFRALRDQDFPAVGDWVAIEARPIEGRATIHGVLPRKTKFSRKVAGKETREQVVATNFNYVFIVSSLNKDLNIRRIERYLVMAWESGAIPVIILSKADLCNNISDKVREVEQVALGVSVHTISSFEKTGIGVLKEYLTQGNTIALLGSSGVGKSTLINCLEGDQILKVQEIREGDDKGKHTTTHRQLIQLSLGGLIIDTPGMRELQLWDCEEGLYETFEDIKEIAYECRFNDCKHINEPGCAIKIAMDEGRLTAERIENYRKLKKEMQYLELKRSKLGIVEQKNNRKVGKKGQKSIIKQKRTNR